MEVNQTYINFLLQLLSLKENIILDKYQQELTVNLYLTLLSLSNIEYSEEINQKEKEIIDDFLRKLNNLKVKIQLKRKSEEINKLASELITQYYENINILSIYIKDGIELENVINTLDAKSLTKFIDEVTKDKMKKEDNKQERNSRRTEITKFLPISKYYIENDMVYIKSEKGYEEISVMEFIETFSYLLNPDHYTKVYNNKANQRSRELIINNIIKLLIVKDKKNEDLKKILVPIILTYILSQDIENNANLDTSDFTIENIKITELYSLASKENQENNNTTKWRQISIPNDYLIEKIKQMITKGMYYYKDDRFVLENIENNTSDFKISIKMDRMLEFLKINLEEATKNNGNFKKKAAWFIKYYDIVVWRF